MVEQRQRTSGTGASLYYDFEYELDSTRGRKRVFSTGACKEGRGAGSRGAAPAGASRTPVRVPAGLPKHRPPPPRLPRPSHPLLPPAVTIAARKLYIANGQVSCGKAAACEGEAAAALPLVRAVTQSLAAEAPR